jgi:mono/diheme cytochrome c family protein
MRLTFPPFGTFLLVPFLCATWILNSSQGKSQEKPAETAAAAEPMKSNAERKNPVKPTPQNLAEAKKFFGYDCAMCHGAAGDGKGDLAASMGLKMNDWRDSSRLAALPDGEMFDLIVKGKGKMIGEGDRYPAETVWELVNYARALAKKETAAAPKTGSSR